MTSNKTWAGICLGVGLTLLAAAISQWPSARAGVPCTLPFNLQNGTPADATQVMANYQAIVTCLGQAAAAGANSDITSLTALTTPVTPAQGGSVVFAGGTTTGSANAQIVSGTTPTFIPTDGFIVTFTAGFTNTGVMTLQVGSTPALTVLRKTVFGGQFTIGGEIISGLTYGVRFRSGAYEILTMEMQIPGEIRDFAGGAGVVPAGWGLADGSCKSRTTFATLFSVIGTTYDPTGATCDVNNFALPDARGRMLIGQDTTGVRITVLGSNCNGNALGGAGCGVQNQTLGVNQLPNLTLQAGSTLGLADATVRVIEPGMDVNRNCPGGTGTCGHSHLVLEPGYDINGGCPGGNCGHAHTGPLVASGIQSGTGAFGSNASQTATTTGTSISGIGIRTDPSNVSAFIVNSGFTGTLQVRTAAQGSVTTLPPTQVVNKIIKF